MSDPKNPEGTKGPEKPKTPKPPKPPKPPKEGADYEVGYGKPPVKNQFKQGNRANPNGRPKDSKSLTTIANRIMDAKISIQKNGAQTKVSTKEALLLRLVSQALAGDRGAMRDALNFLVKMADVNAAVPATAVISPLPAEAVHDVMRDFLSHFENGPDADDVDDDFGLGPQGEEK